MSNYTKSTNFATKDNLTPGDPLKVVRGTEIDTEYNNIATAIATKTDNASAAITGGAIDGATVGATTPATGAFTTLAASGTTTLAGALVGAVTQAAFNTVSTTLNLGGAATAVNLGAATGTATVNNTTLAAKAITASTTLAVTGTSTLTGAVTATAGVSGPITSSSVSITGGSITGITDLAVADGGTGASTAATALNNLLPSQTGNASKYLQTDGTNATWDAVSLSTADITGTLGSANGGTGVSNNAAMTVTGSGNFAYTRTLTGTTNVTFPTTGTLATLAGTETLTNKTLTSPVLTTPTLGVATATSLQGIIGNVTPAAGSFTTVTASTAIGTASGGTGLGGATPFTANGVVFASSTSALATGSALVFDGTTLAITGGQSLSGVLNLSGVNQIHQLSGHNFVQGDSTRTYLYGGTNGIQMRSSNNATELFGMTDAGVFTFLPSGTEGMRLTSTGLGIGTSSPGSYKLKAVGTGGNLSGNAYFVGLFGEGAASNKGVGLGYDSSSQTGIVFGETASAASNLAFWTYSGSAWGERMRLDSAGNLLVGATASVLGSRFYVRGSNTSSSDLNFLFLNSNGDTVLGAYNDGALYANSIKSGAGTNAVKFHTTTGQITYDTSSAHYKDNIRNSIYGLSHVMQMRSAQFEYKDDGRSDVGLIAEELNPIIPELVGKNKHGEPDSVSYDRMVSVLVKAIQELDAKFEAYKASHP